MPEAIISAESTEAPTVRSGRFTISNMSEETIEENLPDLSPHLEDGFSLKQLETLHDYAVEAFKAGIEYANNTRKGAID